MRKGRTRLCGLAAWRSCGRCALRGERKFTRPRTAAGAPRGAPAHRRLPRPILLATPLTVLSATFTPCPGDNSVSTSVYVPSRSPRLRAPGSALRRWGCKMEEEAPRGLRSAGRLPGNRGCAGERVCPARASSPGGSGRGGTEVLRDEDRRAAALVINSLRTGRCSLTPTGNAHGPVCRSSRGPQAAPLR